MKLQSILLSCLFLSGMLYATQKQGSCDNGANITGSTEHLTAEGGTCPLPLERSRSDDNGFGDMVDSEGHSEVGTPAMLNKPGNFRVAPQGSSDEIVLNRSDNFQLKDTRTKEQKEEAARRQKEEAELRQQEEAKKGEANKKDE